MRKIDNRQKLIHRDPIARLLPRYKPAVTRNRKKYSRKGRPRHARAILEGAKGSKGPLSDTPRFHPFSWSLLGAPRARLRAGLGKRPPTDLPRGLSRQAAAEYIGVGTTLFDAMVRDGRMPPPFRVGARVIWDRRKLDAAFDALSDLDEDRNPWDEVAAA